MTSITIAVLLPSGKFLICPTLVLFPNADSFLCRNFTAFQHRFRMPGSESGGVTNFWYSFDYGLAHFVSMDGETDYANSPE